MIRSMLIQLKTGEETEESSSSTTKCKAAIRQEAKERISSYPAWINLQRFLEIHPLKLTVDGDGKNVLRFIDTPKIMKLLIKL